MCGWGKCSGGTSHPSKTTKEESFWGEGFGVWHLGPSRQMSPYGGSQPTIFHRYKRPDMPFGLWRRAVSGCSSSSRPPECHGWEAKTTHKRVLYVLKWIWQYLNTKEKITVDKKDRLGEAQLQRKYIPSQLLPNPPWLRVCIRT